MSAERESLLEATISPLRDPLRDIALAPDPTRGKLADRLRKAVRPRQLVGALLRHAEHLADLRHSYEFHSEGV